MEKTKTPYKLLKHGAMFLLVAWTGVGAVSFSFTVLLPPVVTKTDLGQFDIFGNGSGPVMYTFTVGNNEGKTVTGLQLRYKVECHIRSSGKDVLLFEGLSNVFSLDTNEFLVETNQQFLVKNNPAVTISLQTTIHECNDIETKKLLLDAQKAPDGTLQYTMILSKPDMAPFPISSIHEILNISKLNCLAPGVSPSDYIPPVFDPLPVFFWVSDLKPGIYAAEALSKKPVFSQKVNDWQFRYPQSAATLVPGAVYYWEVAGVLKGSSESEIKSSPYVFRLADLTDNPDFAAIMNLLKRVYGEDILKKIYDYNAHAAITIDGSVKTVDDLRALIERIQAKDLSIKSTRVE
jgi:hypothetical protein